ncbi:gephyrin [Formica exsecta]|uniref:gephyrin n=1 Tax=Formica exsecta TaxID=72781 RepID=UPI00114312D6|nr:gephyrin [Formica exsecta]XP_029675934.1 gephyrin [Formica exsecta]XP_029675935.1 gephyrin [Formica exsecta]XP_029675937.1 gephyrin [Formica exsecta]
MTLIRFAILTVSDTCASGEKVDESGLRLKALINDTDLIGNVLKGEVSCTTIVPDEEALIMKYLIDWSDGNKANVILTTGGTGFSKRDVTPEATKKIIHKEVPGMSLAMFMSSFKITPMAMLSRAVCGIRNKTLIINLPGSSKAATECLNAIAPAIPHAVDLILDNKTKIKDTHNIVQHNITSCLHDKSCTNLINFENVATRLRESPFPMISVKEAVKMIRNSVQKEKEVEIINANDAYGRILWENVYSNCDLPPFRASIKDGYAVLASDGKGIRRVFCGVKAGNTSTLVSLIPDTCVRVNTGAPIPDEATAVVQVEDTKLISKSSDNMEEKEIEILIQPKDGQDIRPIGCDIKKGSLVLNSCTSIGPTEMGLLAACGCKQITVVKLPSIGILSTGDELQEAGEFLKPGHVYDSNKITLITLLKENGFNPLDLGIAIDDESTMVSKIMEAIKKVDVLVTTGSVSMGDRDMLKPILQTYFEATIHFGRVNMKPGKPTTFATCMWRGRKKYFLCLPGNPVSATVTARLFLLPLLNEMRGDFSEPIRIQAKLMSSYNLDPRPEYARAFLKWSDNEAFPLAYSTGNQISSKLLSCKNANALLMLPGRTVEKQMLNKDDLVPAMLIGFK